MAARVNADELIDRVQELGERVDALQDAEARALANALSGAVMEMYGDGLARIVRVLDGAGDAGAAIREELAEDGAVSSLLLIHDLYPVSLEQRVIEALDTVRPYMESHGGNVELLGITEENVAQLRLEGSCSGCAASQATLELAIKQALDEHAPDLAGIDVEGVVESAQSAAKLEGLVELPIVQSPAETRASGPAWTELSEASGLGVGELRMIDAAGAALLLANIDGSLLAYRDECAACGVSLAGAQLDGGMLRCAECGVEFDLPRAGRAAGNEPLQLAPVPLLEDGPVRVAV
ncbi:MAG: NifU family protein [Solirubrobacteraceae bacterium]